MRMINADEMLKLDGPALLSDYYSGNSAGAPYLKDGDFGATNVVPEYTPWNDDMVSAGMWDWDGIADYEKESKFIQYDSSDILYMMAILARALPDTVQQASQLKELLADVDITGDNLHFDGGDDVI